VDAREQRPVVVTLLAQPGAVLGEGDEDDGRGDARVGVVDVRVGEMAEDVGRIVEVVGLGGQLGEAFVVEGTSKNVAIRPDAVRISGVGGDDRGC